jgi:hypothetical protein
VANRPELWKLHNLAQTYGKLPTEVLGVSLGNWEAYQLNAAVFQLGRLVENALAENARSKHPKEAGTVLHKLLYPEAKAEFKPMANRAKKVKLKPGQSPYEVLLND